MVNLYDSTHFDSLLKRDNTKLVSSIPHTSIDQRFCELFFPFTNMLEKPCHYFTIAKFGLQFTKFVIVLQLQKLNYNSQNLPLFDNCRN
jgi:hypothetical protein